MRRSEARPSLSPEADLYTHLRPWVRGQIALDEDNIVE